MAVRNWAWVVALLILGGCDGNELPPAVEGDEEWTCIDGEDNDDDGVIDCDEPACRAYDACLDDS